MKMKKSKPPIVFDGKKYDIEEIYIYPTWRPGTPSSDLALVWLKKAVRGVHGVKIYKRDDEGGRAVVIVGHGETGKIGDKSMKLDGKQRGAINTVDRVSPKTFQLLIKKSEEASDLQGALGPADRGGPAYIQEKDELFVAGIAVWSKDANENNVVDVGDAQTYVRVSAFAPWIEEILLKGAKAELRDYLDVPGT